MLNATCPIAKRLINMMNSYFLFCVTSKPTRVRPNSATLLDHIWTTDIHKNLRNEIIIDSTSDHFPVVSHFALPIIVAGPTLKSIQKRTFSEPYLSNFKQAISDQDWSHVYNCNDANEAYDLFFATFWGTYENYFPIQTKIIKCNSKVPYMTVALRNSLREKRRLHRLALRWPVSYHAQYLQYRDTYNQTVRAAREAYFAQKLQSCVGNPKGMWQHVNSLMGRTKDGNDNSVKSTDITLSDADFINKYFVDSVHTIKRTQPSPPNSFMDYLGPGRDFSFYLSSVTVDEITKNINSIKSKACGHDDVSPIVVKACADVLSRPLQHIINLSFRQGVFPRAMKVAKVVPLHKSGDKSDVKNKRPISVLNIFSKILEKCLVTRLTNYLESHNIVSNKQHGFRRGHSTETAIIQFTNSIYKLLEENNYALAVYIDFSKAFDCLEHGKLISKLENVGIRGNALSLLRDYLDGRSQVVHYNGQQSSPLPILYGCVQGSQLGPTLFSIYVNDLVQITNDLMLCLYADDVNGLKGGRHLYDLYSSVNRELTKIYDWIVCNGLSINILKLAHMLFNYKRCYDMQPMELYIGGSPIPRVFHSKLLGLMIDDRLKWNLHADYVASKVSKMCGIIYLIRKKLNQDALRLLYNCLVYPYLVYCVPIWGGALATHINPVILSQKRAVRAITFTHRREHTLPLFNDNRLMQFKYIHMYFTLLIVFKFIQYNYTVDAFMRLDHLHATRGVANNLSLPPYVSVRGQRSIFYQGPSLWNRLPNNIKSDFVNIVNIFTFKRKLRLYLFGLQLNQI